MDNDDVGDRYYLKLKELIDLPPQARVASEKIAEVER